MIGERLPEAKVGSALVAFLVDGPEALLVIVDGLARAANLLEVGDYPNLGTSEIQRVPSATTSQVENRDMSTAVK